MTRTTRYEDRDPLDSFYTPASASYVLMEYLKGRLHGIVWEPFCGKGFIAKALTKQNKQGKDNAINRIICSDLDYRAKKFCGIYDLNWEDLELSFERREDLSGVDAFKAIEGGNPVNCLTNPQRKFNWVVSNPPYLFNKARWFVDQGKILSENEFVGEGKLTSSEWIFMFLTMFPNASLAMYMRVTWLEPSNERAALFKQFPPTDILFLPRNDFVLPNGKKLKGNNCSSAWVIWDRQATDVQKGTAHNAWYNRIEVDAVFSKYELS